MADSKITVASNVFGDGLTPDAYAKCALLWAKTNIAQKQKIFCPALNSDIYVSVGKLKHSIYYKKHTRKEGHENDIISVIHVLERLIETATHRFSVDDKSGREDIVKIHKLKSTAVIDGVERNIEITVRETIVNKDGETNNYFYYHCFTG